MSTGAQALIPRPRRRWRHDVLHDSRYLKIHFVAALHSVPEMRGVSSLFEDVAAGAAADYAQMADDLWG
jgi:hypothetical protein